MLDFVDGRVWRLRHAAFQNTVPTALLTVHPLTESAPLTVMLSAAGTSDPDADGLLYHWSFGDASPSVITDVITLTHRYEQDGAYRIRLQVSDPRGGESAPVEEMVTVYSGEIPTIELVNANDPGRTLFHSSDIIG